MRDLVILMALIVIFPIAISNTFVAYLIWCWSALISLDEYTFGFMRSVRINLIFALISLGLIFLSSKNKEFRLPLGRTGIFFALFAMQATISVIFGYPNNPNNVMLYEHLMKGLLFAAVMPMVVVTHFRIHALLIAIALGVAFHGLVDGLKFLATGGGHIVQGLMKFGDNNHFAIALVVVLPILIYLFQYSRSQWARLGGGGALVLSILAVIGTRSRGGFVGMTVVGISSALASRKKWLSLTFVCIGVAMVILMAPASWSERMNTIRSADQDGSFMQRVEAWQVSSAIAINNPLTGGGFHAVQTQPVWDQFRGLPGILGFVYIENPSFGFRAAHSIYFEVLGDMGFIGLAIFFCLLANIFITRAEIKRKVKKVGPTLFWARDLSDALAAGIAAFMVGGATVSLAYFEVIYMVAMLMEILKQLVIKES